MARFLIKKIIWNILKYKKRFVCFCGNSYGKYGTSAKCTSCKSPNSYYMCGDTSANSVYRIRSCKDIF